MPMTLAEWNEWSVEKREFYAKLFTCYSISEYGVLCIDSKRRQFHVQEQLINKDQKIITRATLLANYILTNGIDKKSGNLVDTEHNISCLLLTSKELSTNKHKLVGGFWQSTQNIPDNFVQAVKEKLRLEEKLAIAIKDDALFIPLGNIDDLTVLSSCALEPSEAKFLVRDRLFIKAIKEEAHYLSEKNGVTSSADIEKKINEHLCVASVQGVQQTSLLNLNVPTVSTYWVLYNQPQFKNICKYIDGLELSSVTITLNEALCLGPSKFLFLSEYINLLKIALWCCRLDGKSCADIIKIIKEPINYSEFECSQEHVLALFQGIATKKIEGIKTANLPLPPCFMGTTWDSHYSPDEILKTLRNFHYVDLFTMAEIAGFRRADVYSVFGLAPTTLLDKVEKQHNHIWQKNESSLLKGVLAFIEKMLEVGTVSTTQAGAGMQGMFGRSLVKKETMGSHDLSEESFKSSL